jgi:hypothetical protein
MIDNDQHLLWEAYLEKKSTDHHDKKHKGKYDDGDDKDEKCDYVPCEDGDVKKEGTDGETADLNEYEKARLAAHAAKKGKGPLAEMDGDMDMSIPEEKAYERPGLEHIQDATRNLTGDNPDDGDWEGAIRTACQGIAEYIIFHADPPEADVADATIVGSVLTDPDLADHWDFKTGVKDAASNLLSGSEYEQLANGFKKAFHRAAKDKESGRFNFDNETLLSRLKANQARSEDARRDDSRLSDMPPREPGL